MNWRLQQRIFELVAVGFMIAGIAMMWMHMDQNHLVIYMGFMLLASGKLVEALNIRDPGFVMVKVAACICMYLLVILNIVYHVNTIIYLMIPLGLYYVLHYRLMFRQRKA